MLKVFLVFLGALLIFGVLIFVSMFIESSIFAIVALLVAVGAISWVVLMNT